MVFKQKILCFALVLALFVSVFTACTTPEQQEQEQQTTTQTQQEEPEEENELSYTDFADKSVGFIGGSLASALIDDIGAIPVDYPEDTALVLEDLRSGLIDGFMTDLATAEVITNAAENSDLRIINIPADVFFGHMGAFSSKQDVIDEFNTFLTELKESGMFDEMQVRWFENTPDENNRMPDIETTGENGTLVVATSASSIPFSYFGAGDDLLGYSVELALRFAASLGMDCEFVITEFGELIDHVESGDVDLGLDSVTINNERSERVLFSDPIYSDRLAIITGR